MEGEKPPAPYPSEENKKKAVVNEVRWIKSIRNKKNRNPLISDEYVKEQAKKEADEYRQSLIDEAHRIVGNTAPTLKVGKVDRGARMCPKKTRYSVMYFDYNNNPPAYVDVWINGQAHTMEKTDHSDMNYKDGCEYQYITKLPLGMNDYCFRTSDWLGYAKLPKKGDFKGPKKKSLNFSIELKGGWSSWALKDFSASKEGYEKLIEIIDGYTTTNELSGSIFRGFDAALEFNLDKSHSLVLSSGFQYFPGGRFEQSLSTEFYSVSSTLELSTLVIPIELYLKWNFGNCTSFKIGGGMDFLQVIIDYSYSAHTIDYDNIISGKLKDSGRGGHVMMGTEYRINKNLALTLDGGYNFAKLKNCSGTLTAQDGSRTDMMLVMEAIGTVEILGLYYATEPLPPSLRAAEIDLSGFKFSVGFRYRFFGK